MLLVYRSYKGKIAKSFYYISFLFRFFLQNIFTSLLEDTHESVPNHYSTNTSAASLMKLCTSTAKQEKRRVAVTAQILHPFPSYRGNILY